MRKEYLIQLIAMLDSKKINSDKTTDNISNNQNLLLKVVQKFLNYDKNYLLDGHFCLIDRNYLIKEIPINTYMSLGIKEILLLTNDEEVIVINQQLNCKSCWFCNYMML